MALETSSDPTTPVEHDEFRFPWLEDDAFDRFLETRFCKFLRHQQQPQHLSNNNVTTSSTHPIQPISTTTTDPQSSHIPHSSESEQTKTSSAPTQSSFVSSSTTNSTPLSCRIYKSLTKPPSISRNNPTKFTHHPALTPPKICSPPSVKTTNLFDDHSKFNNQTLPTPSSPRSLSPETRRKQPSSRPPTNSSIPDFDSKQDNQHINSCFRTSHSRVARPSHRVRKATLRDRSTSSSVRSQDSRISSTPLAHRANTPTQPTSRSHKKRPPTCISPDQRDPHPTQDSPTHTRKRARVVGKRDAGCKDASVGRKRSRSKAAAQTSEDLWSGDDRRQTITRSAPKVCGRVDQVVHWSAREARCFAVQYSSIHRFGLFAKTDIPVGAMVVEYMGERISRIKSEVRDAMYSMNKMDMYMFQLRKGTDDVIDGTLRGGPAKYVNHCCEPNAEAEEIVEVVRKKSGHEERVHRIWFISTRDIKAGGEILVDYGMKREPGERLEPCNCRRKSCRGILNYA